MNDLFLEPQISGFGVKVGEVFCGSPMYADDVSMVASSPVELQSMNIVDKCARKWRYSINPKILLFGPRK